MYVCAVYCTPNMELSVLQYRLTGKRMHICSTTLYTRNDMYSCSTCSHCIIDVPVALLF